MKYLRIKKPDWRTIAGIFLAISILPLFIIFMHAGGVIFTYTGSVPIGFYKILANKNEIKQGDYVSFCLPDNIAKVGIARGYINKGDCDNGSEEIIKKVIAVPSDTVKLTDEQIIVNGISYKAPVHIIDKNGTFAERFIKNGIYRNIQDYWVYGFGSFRYSWDSHYYGGIPKSRIRHKLIPILTF